MKGEGASTPKKHQHETLPYIVQGGQTGQPPPHNIIDVMESAGAGQAIPDGGPGQHRLEAGADIR